MRQMSCRLCLVLVALAVAAPQARAGDEWRAFKEAVAQERAEKPLAIDRHRRTSGDNGRRDGCPCPASSSPSPPSPTSPQCSSYCNCVCATAPTAAPIRVGLLWPEKGPVASFAKPLQDAAMLAIDEANGDTHFRGGANITVDARNSGCQSSVAVESAAAMMQGDGVEMMIGPLCSSAAARVLAEVAVPNRVPMISYGASGPQLSAYPGDAGFLSRTALGDDARTKMMVKKMVGDRHVKLVMTYANNPYGQGTQESLQSAMQKAGGEVLAAVPHELGQTDEYYKGIATNLNTACQNCTVVLIAYTEGGEAMLKNLDATRIQALYVFDEMMTTVTLEHALKSKTIALSQKRAGLSAGNDHLLKITGVNWVSPFTQEAYDAGALAVLALAMGGRQLHTNIGRAGNPPGVVVYPGQLKKALALISRGEEVHYVGATHDRLVATATKGFENPGRFAWFIPGNGTWVRTHPVTYNRITSGVCSDTDGCERITTVEECKNATTLALPDYNASLTSTVASTASVAQYAAYFPNGCIVSEGEVSSLGDRATLVNTDGGEDCTRKPLDQGAQGCLCKCAH